MGGQPTLGVLVVERPGWNDDEECQSSTGEANVERQLDVLCHEADEESQDLP